MCHADLTDLPALPGLLDQPRDDALGHRRIGFILQARDRRTPFLAADKTLELHRRTLHSFYRAGAPVRDVDGMVGHVRHGHPNTWLGPPPAVLGVLSTISASP